MTARAGASLIRLPDTATPATPAAGSSILGSADGTTLRVTDDGGTTLTTAMREAANTFTGAQTIAVPSGTAPLTITIGGTQRLLLDSGGTLQPGSLNATNSVTTPTLILAGNTLYNGFGSRLSSAATSTSTTFAGAGPSVTLSAGRYTFRIRGQYRTAATTTGIALRVGGTLTASSIRYETTIYGLTATTYTHQTGSAMGAAQAATPSVAAATTDYGFTIEGGLVVSAGGTLTLDFATEVAGSTATIQPETTLYAQQIG